VGRHVPPPYTELDDYLNAFAESYDVAIYGGSDKILAVMAAHHRLVWIHPFTDGNGRVARLHTDLGLRQAGVQAVGVWCLSRGLAKKMADYKSHLQEADTDRQGDQNGRGARSEAALIRFINFMLDTALDQVHFIGELLKPAGMRQRIESYVTHRGTGVASRELPPLRKEAAPVLQQAFLMGEIRREDMAQISGLQQASARKLFQQLKAEGFLTETSSRSPLYWAIPDHAETWYFPDLATPAAKALGSS
jgi:Fic family protein